ncbi:hypothetical protein RclHR1_00380015 [Rhizophagus clarus]|uniref:Uncharacterized protein n=1 Tax=Rhizophagus clarus TaxID=94130 RepID=A0A2Z6S7E3_9GLOM|nr:hypothetical protein RclHR1_00380015 [Rhizophagus clarus]
MLHRGTLYFEDFEGEIYVTQSYDRMPFMKSQRKIKALRIIEDPQNFVNLFKHVIQETYSLMCLGIELGRL